MTIGLIYRRLPNKVAFNAFSKSFSSTAQLKSAEDLKISVENGIKRIVINRPRVKNAMSFAMMDKLGRTLHQSNTDATKLITITGAGDYFTSGNDFNNFKSGTIAEIKETMRESVVEQLFHGFIDCRKPIIALVNGGAIGIGTTMLLHCDQVLASDKAFFLTPFVSIGILPEFGSSYYFQNVLGNITANDMLVFGSKMGPDDALKHGLISKIIPSQDFYGKCDKLIESYANIPLEPLMKSKDLIRAPDRERLKRICAYELDVGIKLALEGDALKKAEAFLSKKK